VFDLDDHYVALQGAARELAESVAAHAHEADGMLEVHPAMAAALKASRLTELTVPAAYGGRDPQVDSLAITVVREQLMRVSAHLDGLFGMQGIGSFAVSVAGTDVVREEWLPKVATLDAIAALALTEPAVGSDLRSITTTLVARGGSLFLDGHKSFITNAGAADFYSVLCREGDGYSMAFVPADLPGVSVTVGPRLIAPHIMGEVVFTGVEIPERFRIGAPGEAFKLMLATLATFRVSVAGAAVGLAQGALEEAVRHAGERQQFGRTLAELGPIPHMIGTSWVELEASRMLTYRAAALAAEDPLGNLDFASMAKVSATETAGRVVDRCVQIMGRFGLVEGSTIERLYRNARPMRIYEGGNEVLTGQLAKRLAKRLGG